jgi:hypothetical protein
MNALISLCMAILMAQVGITALPTPPASGQSQMGQMQATTVRTTSVSVPCAPLPPCACYIPQPCGNVAPWSWQHDNQNDNEWPADHGG